MRFLNKVFSFFKKWFSFNFDVQVDASVTSSIYSDNESWDKILAKKEWRKTTSECSALTEKLIFLQDDITAYLCAPRHADLINILDKWESLKEENRHFLQLRRELHPTPTLLKNAEYSAYHDSLIWFYFHLSLVSSDIKHLKKKIYNKQREEVLEIKKQLSRIKDEAQILLLHQNIDVSYRGERISDLFEQLKQQIDKKRDFLNQQHNEHIVSSSEFMSLDPLIIDTTSIIEQVIDEINGFIGIFRESENRRASLDQRQIVSADHRSYQLAEVEEEGKKSIIAPSA